MSDKNGINICIDLSWLDAFANSMSKRFKKMRKITFAGQAIFLLFAIYALAPNKSSWIVVFSLVAVLTVSVVAMLPIKTQIRKNAPGIRG